MKVEVVKAERKRDDRHAFYIIIDGEEAAMFMEGEAEDATLARDYNDVFNIPNIIKLAYDAGKRGEDLEIVNKKIDWEDI